MIGRRFRKLTGILLGLALTLQCGAPSFAAVTAANEEAAPWYESIPEMLSAGEYEEGVVVAGIAAEKKDEVVSDETVELMEVDSDAASADGAVKVSSETENVSITLIRRDDMTTEEILRELAEDGSVVFAEPNYIVTEQSAEDASVLSEEDLARIRERLGMDADTEGTEATGSPIAPPETVVTAEDLTGLQWGNTDEADLRFSDEDVSIHVPDFGAGGSNMEGDPVVIAVFDMPIDFSHPDLKDVAYTFTPEQQEALGCDQHGYNASWSNNDGKMVYFKGGDHGTHCAGIIGASWDNHGISGVASNVKLISIQLSEVDTTTSLASLLRGMEFVDRANEMGVGIRITSNSWGLTQNCRAFDTAVRYLGEKYGILTVLAAGNERTCIDQLNYSAASVFDNPYVITVASTNAFGELSDFSNYGRQSVTMGAPGSGILSTVYTGSASYIPDAVENKYYEGFETSTDIKVYQLNEDKEKVDAGVDASICEDIGFSGTKVLRFEFDPDQECFEYEYGKGYNYEFELGDMSGSGVEAGDHLGFAVAAPDGCLVVAAACVDSEGDSVPATIPVKEVDRDNWAVADLTIPEGADLSNFRFRIVLLFMNGVTEGKVYFDSLGIGSECVAYAFYDGTSMACPAVSGAAALIASRNPEVKGEDLAAMVRSSVRSLSSLSGKTKTGGILDLSVSPLDPVSGGPVIRSISNSGNKVVLSGLNFGDEQGSVSLTKEVAGAGSEAISCSVVSWTDTTVTLEMEQDFFYGVMRAELTSSRSHKSDSITRLFNESIGTYMYDYYYETCNINDPFNFDRLAALETDGVMLTRGDWLYFIPKEVKVEENPAYQHIYLFNLENEQWEGSAKFLNPLSDISAAVTEDGWLYTKGTGMNVVNGYPVNSEEPEVEVIKYKIDNGFYPEPLRAKAKGVSINDTLVSDGERMYLVGDGRIRRYDPEEGAGETVFTFDDEEIGKSHPIVAISEDNLYLFDDLNYRAWVVTGLQEDPELKELELPDIIYGDTASVVDELDRSMHGGTLVAVSDGVMLIGPTAADNSADTFLLRNGETSFISWGRAANEKIVGVTGVAVTVRDNHSLMQTEKIFVIATAFMDEKKFIFRADDYKYEDLKPVPQYSNEWVHGKWFNKDGSQTYTGQGSWRKDKKGYRYGDTKGWYPKNRWQKIDGKWYFFDKEGYMESNAYRNGWYLGANGAWDGKAQAAGWKQDAKGWWYSISGKSYLKTCWKKIDGGWYYFTASGYAAHGEFVQGWWLNEKNCLCTYPYRARWRKDSRGWWYGDDSGWYAKNSRQTIDGVKYRFDARGYYIP